MSTEPKHTQESNRLTAPRHLSGDQNRSAVEFIFTIDRLISGLSTSDVLWNYCVQYRESALKDAEQNHCPPKLKQERDELLAALKAIHQKCGEDFHEQDPFGDIEGIAHQAIMNATTP